MRADETQTENLISKAISEGLADGERAVLATLMTRPGDASGQMHVGAKLLVRSDGQAVGTFGAPDLDEAVIEQARRFMPSRDEAKSYQVQEFAPNLRTLVNANILFERIEAEPRLVICGAGHVGAALAGMASLAGYRVTLIDDRAEFVQRELFSSPAQEGIELLTAQNWSTSVTEAVGHGRGVSVAIVTRGHKQDEECLRAVIPAAPDYVGMIGSKRRTSIVLDRLRDEGFAEEALRNVHAPIGLDIGAVSPEEVALAILAEVVAERRGGSGARLSDWRRRK